jgi:geranylgeranyl pyrophosphate synthase
VSAVWPTYGMHLGTAFQIIDDVLDYSGAEVETGKHLGDDLAEGKPTLPLIHVMQHGNAEQATCVRRAIENGGRDDFARRAGGDSCDRRAGACEKAVPSRGRSRRTLD